ncbi:SRPBCC family protein [Cesiribacter andamanensis]|uniref:Polyketide cyclase / dehydrase and lipid transport n=1 Tax=Cesiribacter andamanensis AMV16 TaxID=1279009 RepID=M7N0Z5_9BACT|nr:SRPBCC family protein [Cesiribacter andamanensis]EMR02338.1 Polyketide cyclase / dehydrase and lipid transport [Cesiribacter andamanensis AMV16]
MKLIRAIALLLAGILIIALATAAFMPETMEVEGSIEINKPVEEVFNHVADLRNWHAWNPWSEMDPEATHEISTPSRGKGAKWSWTGEKLGKGSLQQQEIEENEMIRFSLVFEEPMESSGIDTWYFERTEDNTTLVTWKDEMAMEYPHGRLATLFVKPGLEEQLNRGLQKLKALIEKDAAPTPQPASPPADSAGLRVSGI